MTRLRIVVEGQSEEAFVTNVLQPHLAAHDVFADATVVGKEIARRRGHRRRGGGHYRHWRRDLERHLRGDHSGDLRVTTLFDLYGLPDDFPGVAQHGSDADTNRRCDPLQQALARDLPDRRFLPYIQRHEFEALVLAGAETLEGVLDAEEDSRGLAALRDDIGDTPPEDVNDGPETAPSKRLLRHIPSYTKTIHGPLAIEAIGLPNLRARCPRFDAWLRQLEALGSPMRA